MSTVEFLLLVNLDLSTLFCVIHILLVILLFGYIDPFSNIGGFILCFLRLHLFCGLLLLNFRLFSCYRDDCLQLFRVNRLYLTLFNYLFCRNLLRIFDNVDMLSLLRLVNRWFLIRLGF
jgi:hypothetical protein